MRLISCFTSGCNSWSTPELLQQYFDFIVSIDNPTRLIFVDKKPMKEVDIFGCVRRDPFFGNALNHEMNVNSKNRYSILAPVTLKKADMRPVVYVILENTADSCLFLQFIRILFNIGTLQRGDVFLVDNCNIHLQGANIRIQEDVFTVHVIIVITPPPPPLSPRL